MIHLFHKDNFPTKLFVSSAICAFILFLFLYFLSIAGFNPLNPSYSDNKKITEIYNLDKNFEYTDNMITAKPTLKEILKSPIISANDPITGNENSQITIVEFSDFECKACRSQEAVLKQAVEKFKARLVWKDYPESNMNSNSFQAAIAGRCAQAQNKFWDYHDAIFASANTLNKSVLINTAEELGLDMEKFNSCLDNKVTKQLVLDNIEEADALYISGIPFIYVNDQEIMGEISFDDLAEIIKKVAK